MNKLLSLFVFLMVSVPVVSQSYIEDIHLEGVGLYLSENTIDSTFRVKVHVRVSDTLNVDSLFLRIGTSLHGSQLFSGAYDVQAENELEFPQSIDIERHFFQIVIGDFTLNNLHFYELELKDSSGARYSTFIKEM